MSIFPRKTKNRKRRKRGCGGVKEKEENKVKLIKFTQKFCIDFKKLLMHLL